MDENLALQIASLKEALEKQTEATAEKNAVAELKQMFQVEHPESLVSAIKEKMMFLASQVEGERKMYAHHAEANTLLRSERAILRDQLESANMRVQVLESEIEMRRQGLL